jgi:hypothetical protein
MISHGRWMIVEATEEKYERERERERENALEFG